MTDYMFLFDPLTWLLWLLLLLVLLLLLLWWRLREPPAPSQSVVLYDHSIEGLDCDGTRQWPMLNWLDGPRNVLISVQNKGVCPIRIFLKVRGRDLLVLEAAPGPIVDLGAGPQPKPGFPTATATPLRRGMVVYAVCGGEEGEPECKFDIQIKTV